MQLLSQFPQNAGLVVVSTHMFWQMTSDPPQDREDDGTEELPLPTLELETAALDALAKELL